MIDVKVSMTADPSPVLKSADKAIYRNEGHAAASISKDAKASIETGKVAGPAGRPPRTKKGKLRRAIRFAVDRAKQTAVIGPVASLVGSVGAAHEHGEQFRGDDFDKRPFMGPSLERNAHRFSGSFEGSVGD